MGFLAGQSKQTCVQGVWRVGGRFRVMFSGAASDRAQQRRARARQANAAARDRWLARRGPPCSPACSSTCDGGLAAAPVSDGPQAGRPGAARFQRASAGAISPAFTCGTACRAPGAAARQPWRLLAPKKNCGWLVGAPRCCLSCRRSGARWETLPGCHGASATSLL